MLNNIFNTLISNVLQNSNNPLMQMFNQNFKGKNKEEQMQTLLNMAQAQGKDINTPIISKEDFNALCKLAKKNKNIKF